MKDKLKMFINKLPKRHLAIFFVLFCGIVIGSVVMLTIKSIHADTQTVVSHDQQNPGDVVNTSIPTTPSDVKQDTGSTNVPVITQSSPTTAPVTPQGNQVGLSTSTPSPCH